MASKGKKGKDKKTKEKSPKKPRNLYKLYDIQGDTIKRKNPFSPKSPGDFLARHKDRVVCGKTGYTEVTKKEEKKE